MDFEDIEAGGFDDGQGNQNVSSQAEADNLVSHNISSLSYTRST